MTDYVLQAEPGQIELPVPASKDGRRIYLASSWRNPYQAAMVAMLRAEGHKVYDFRNPAPDNKGFSWSQINPNWLDWSAEHFVAALGHPIAQAGFKHDKDALDWCDTCVLLLPSGRSAHLEAGYCAGQGKEVFTLLLGEKNEPELMYLLGTGLCLNPTELMTRLDQPIRGI